MGRFATINGLTLNPVTADTYTATDGTNTYTVVYSANFDPLGVTSSPAEGSGNDIAVTGVVPEPATMSLALLAGFGLLARRRRRNAR